ncbi:hypothetical protein I4F81_002748 [Pyropia yezoensis]|uniref:Uncharacterized protein n=1 Tax=Pyropia yezoensis TaxID=2788 RepID=A0ACC3BQC6_PYRYE|nr:hypothetical protein I4F81_002748 [Neopyropia yezoensis]
MTGRALRPASADATTPQRADLQSPPAAAPTRGPARAPAAAGRPDPEGTPRVRPVPYAAPTGVAPDATARARNRAGDADLVVPPTVHLHGGPEGEVSAELSAGRIQWVDGLNACTVRNLSARLFSAKPEVGGRLIRLGCLFSPAARAGFLGDTFDGVGLPSGDGRSPAQAKADRGSFEAIVHLANYCAAFRLDVECTRAVVEQALHVAEKGNHHLVKSVLSGVRNDYQKHSVSATHGGKKTTMATYAGYIKRFCAWGVAGERVGTRLVPLSRHTVVLFLEAEAKRRLVRRAAPRRGAGMADEADSDDGDEDAEDEGDVDEYLSGGSFYAATAVVGRRKRDRMLQETSAGTAKAKGKRKPTVSDEQRRRVAKALLETVGSQEFQKLSRINAVYTLQFALEARGATARDLGLSDVAVHTFPGLFSAGGKDLEVLCFYISATKTTDGVVRCIGALPHVDAWLCPVGAFADGLYALCHRPGGDSSAPPGDFRPVFRPDDEELLAAGVRPAHFREAGTDVGWRVWYRWLLFPAPNGGILKAMSYRYHNDAMRPVLMAQGVPDWAAKTHLMRKAAAQAGRQRGASEADSREHGIWTPGIGGGVYDGTLPNAPMTLALSGRPADCAAPSTPRLAVPVPEELQASFLPWLEDEEQSLAQRVAADPRAEDEALKDFFKVARWMRSVYFQTWAARLATASTPTHSYLKHHPLLRVPAFQSYCKTMAEALKAAGDVAANAVDEALPALSAAVGHAVQTVATATAVELGALEKRLSERTADDVAAVKQHVDAGVARVVAHGDAAAQDTRGHVDARFDALEATQRRQWELLARCLNDGVVKDPRARALLREELARAPPPHPQSAAGGLARSATVPLAQHTPAPPARASARLQADREHVRSLQAQGLLAGVPIHQTPDEAVPLLCMGTGLTWELALDEYAVGINGQVAIRVLDERFGNRWRLRQEGEAKRRHIKLYSERAALYRAFDVEYLRRGHSVGIDGVLAWLKSKYRAAKNTKEVLTLLRKDYPSGGGTA